MQHEQRTEENLPERMKTIRGFATQGIVCQADLDRLRRAVLLEGALTRAEADALFDVECSAARKDEAWTALFVEAITDHVVWETRPTGAIDPATGEWLMRRVDEARSLTALAALVNIVAEAPRMPLWFLAAVRARAARDWPGVSDAVRSGFRDAA